jgi:hypothetical protein
MKISNKESQDKKLQKCMNMLKKHSFKLSKVICCMIFKYVVLIEEENQHVEIWI